MSWDPDELEYRYGFDRYGHFPRGPDPKWVDPSQTREKWDWPYAYSEFFLFGGREAIEKKKEVSAVYSDRLWQWWVEKKDSKSYDDLWKKHVGRRYDQASAAQLGAFLTEYHQTLWPEKHEGNRISVVACAEGCNPSNGYPYWIVWYVEKN